MSIAHLFKSLIASEDGAIRLRTHRWVFIKSPAQLERMIADFAARRGDKSTDFARRVISAKDDDRGRRVAVKLNALAYCCPDVESYGSDHPVLDGMAWVPKSVCCRCDNRVRSRVQKGRWACKILRERRQGLTQKTVVDAIDRADRLIRGAD